MLVTRSLFRTYPFFGWGICLMGIRIPDWVGSNITVLHVKENKFLLSIQHILQLLWLLELNIKHTLLDIFMTDCGRYCIVLVT